MFDSYPDSALPPGDDAPQYDIANLMDDLDGGWDEEPDGPSLPIILLSSACGLATGIIGLYVGYELLRLTLAASAAFGTLAALTVLAGMAAALTRWLGSEAYVPNIGMGCGLMVLSVLFFCVCILSGALVATILLSLGG